MTGLAKPYTDVIDWQETMNGVTIDCSLDIAVHPANSEVIILTVPGVDGSVDGYDKKYVRIAESVQKQHGAAVVRMANPFITSFHWESNLRRVLDYISDNAVQITGGEMFELRIMAHSAGAAVVAKIAHEYPFISRILLINTATKLGLDQIKNGLAKFDGNRITIIYGSKDPSVGDLNALMSANKTARMSGLILDNVDHDFSGDALDIFIAAPHAHLFNKNMNS